MPQPKKVDFDLSIDEKEGKVIIDMDDMNLRGSIRMS